MNTPDTSLPPLGDPPRRKMLVEIEVSADFEKRLDNQWMVEREINADRWSWQWKDSDRLAQLERDNAALRGALEGVMQQVKEGRLVRDIRGDAEPGWALKQVPLVRALAVADQVLANPAAVPPKNVCLACGQSNGEHDPECRRGAVMPREDAEALAEVLEDIKLWCEGSACVECGKTKMRDTDCYDYCTKALATYRSHHPKP